MKYLFFIFFTLISITTKTQQPAQIIKTYDDWWSYTSNNIKLAQDFTALDENDVTITKKEFLNRLLTGNYYAFKTAAVNAIPRYKLYTLPVTKTEIAGTIKQLAGYEVFYDDIEGKTLPYYIFKTLSGKMYNNANTKGKVVVLKCWFIHCVACVQEFPEVNKLVDEYSSRGDVLFISLAFDTNQQLANFLKTKQLKYEVVPNKENYVTNQLGILMFPTHIIINKKGRVIKAVTSAEDLAVALKKELGE